MTERELGKLLGSGLTTYGWAMVAPSRYAPDTRCPLAGKEFLVVPRSGGGSARTICPSPGLHPVQSCGRKPASHAEQMAF
jgi:hypothetical protein